MVLKVKDKLFLGLLVLVVLALAVLRFGHLGYSDYIPDETTVMDHYKDNGPVLDLVYLAKQRKGPMQWLIVLTTNFLYRDVFNELVFRIPFALASVLSIVFFYKFLEEHTKNKYLAIFAAFLFGVNGFMVAFGRIVQYQSLNLLFSSISLYLFAKFLNEKDAKYCLYGTVFFAFSLLAHWDAVFILPYIIYVFIKRENLKLVFFSGLLTLVLYMPFFVPFAFFNYFSGEKHDNYFENRIGLRNEFNLTEIRFKNALYNPFLFLQFSLAMLLISLIWVRKYLIFWIWFIFTLAVFAFFVRAPGTHVYNMVIPLTILTAAAFVEVAKLLPKDYRLIPFGLALIIGGFLYYQSYLIFIDLGKQYPWEQEDVFRYKTKNYDHGNLTNNIIGFPHGRNWTEIREFIHSQEGFKQHTFFTNENSAMAAFYLDMTYERSSKMYVIGVKDPYSFVTDYKFSQLRSKKTVKTVKDVNGNTLAKIYLVE